MMEQTIDYSNVTKKEIIGMRFFESLYAIKDENRKQYAVSMAEQRAQELNISRQFSKGWQTFLHSKAKTGTVTGNRTNFPELPFALHCGDWIADADGVKRMVQESSIRIPHTGAAPGNFAEYRGRYGKNPDRVL